MKKILLLSLFSLAVMGSAHAEKADSEKEAVITAQRGQVDDIKQTRTLTGDVVLVKGTLTMKAGRALITEDPQGYQFITFWADAGRAATNIAAAWVEIRIGFIDGLRLWRTTDRS